MNQTKTYSSSCHDGPAGVDRRNGRGRRHGAGVAIGWFSMGELLLLRQDRAASYGASPSPSGGAELYAIVANLAQRAVWPIPRSRSSR